MSATATGPATATVTVTAPAVLTKSIGTFLKAEAAVGKAWEGMFTSLREAADENKWTEKEQRQIALDLSFKEALRAFAEKEGYTGDGLSTVVETRFTAKAPDRAKIMILAFPKCPVAEQDKAREAGMGINDLLTLSRKAENTVESVKAEKAAKNVAKAAQTIASAGTSPAAAGTPTATTASTLSPQEKFEAVLANVIVAARKDGLLNAAIISSLNSAAENCRKLDAGK